MLELEGQLWILALLDVKHLLYISNFGHRGYVRWSSRIKWDWNIEEASIDAVEQPWSIQLHHYAGHKDPETILWGDNLNLGRPARNDL